MPDKPFFVYYAPGATHAPHHVRPEWSDKYKGAFDDGWDALRERTFAKQKELGVIPPDAELTERPDGDPRLGRHAGRPEAGARAPDGGLRRLPRAHRPPRRAADRRARRAGDPRRHARLLRSSATTAPRPRARRTGCFNELVVLNGAAGLETTEFMVSRIDDFGTPDAYNHYAVGWAHAMDTPVPVDEAGRLALGRHAQRDDRALAGRHQGEGRDPLAVPPRDRRRADGARGGRPAGAAERQRRAAAAARGRLDGLHVRRRGGGRPPHDAVLRDVLQPRHLPRGLDRGDAPQHPVGGGRDAGLRRRRLGALRPRRLDAGPRPRRRRSRQAARAAAPLPDRGREVQRPAARRSAVRALQRRPGRTAAARPAAPRSCSSAAWAGCPRTRSS